MKSKQAGYTYLVFLLMLAVGASFAMLNAGSVTLNYYLGKTQISLSLLLALSLGLGILIGFFVGITRRFRFARRERQLKKQIDRLSQEISNLRSIPIKDAH